MNNVRWTKEEIAYLKENYGLKRGRILAEKISQIHGNKRSLNSVCLKAQKLKLEHDKAEGCLSIAEAAKLAGLNVHIFYHAIRNGLIKPLQSQGKCLFISLEDFDKIREKYSPIPKGYTLTKTQARKLLGYSETQITRHLLGGFLRGHRHGDRWYVDESHVKQLIQEMKRKCLVRLDLSAVQTEYMQTQRSKCNEYNRNRRAKA